MKKLTQFVLVVLIVAGGIFSIQTQAAVFDYTNLSVVSNDADNDSSGWTYIQEEH